MPGVQYWHDATRGTSQWTHPLGAGAAGGGAGLAVCLTAVAPQEGVMEARVKLGPVAIRASRRMWAEWQPYFDVWEEAFERLPADPIAARELRRHSTA
jgi:hypothetical protein